MIMAHSDDEGLVIPPPPRRIVSGDRADLQDG